LDAVQPLKSNVGDNSGRPTIGNDLHIGGSCWEGDQEYREALSTIHATSRNRGVISFPTGGSRRANDFKVEKIELVSVAGRDGYHATATFLDEQGLSKRLQLYGAMIEGYICEFCYLATEPIYYEKYRPVFDKMMSTVKVAE
jgi:hypothetical protein